MPVYRILRKDKISHLKDTLEYDKVPVPIELLWKKGFEKFAFQIGEKVPIKNFDFAKSKVKGMKSEGIQINEMIQFYESKIQEAERNIRLKSLVINKSNVKEEFLNLINHKQSEKPKSFFDIIDDYHAANVGSKSKNYIRFVNQLKTKLESFRSRILLSDVNHDLVDQYIEYLINEFGLSNQTIQNHVKFLRNISKYADRKGYEVSKDYLDFSFRAEKTQRIVFLTEDELERLITKDYNSDLLRKVADIYVFACHTGLRYSDLSQVTHDNINGGVLTFTATKTRKEQKVSLSDTCCGILDRYDGSLPLMTNQKLNEYLKIVGAKANLNEVLTDVSYSGSKRREVKKKKYQLLSMHTARHTFATLSLKRGLDLHTLKEVLGHSSISITEQYLHVMENEKLQKMKSIWN